MQVHAEAVTAVVGYVLVGLALSALGCSVGALTGDEECKATYQSLYNGIDQTVKDGCYGVNDIVTRVTPEFLQAVGDGIVEIWNNNTERIAMQNIFPNGIDFVNPIVNDIFMNGLFRPKPYLEFNGSPLYANKFKRISIMGNFDYEVNSRTWNVSKMRKKTDVSFLLTGSGDSNSGSFKVGTDPTEYNVQLDSIYAYGNTKGFTNFHYVFAAYTDFNDVSGYMVFTPITGSSNVRILTNKGAKEMTEEQEMARYKMWLHGKSIGLNSVSDVVGEIKKQVGVVDPVTGKTTIPLTNTGAKDKLDANNRTQTQDKTIGKDIATTTDKAADDTANKSNDTTIPKPLEIPDLALPEIIFKEKFPFCLPWDFYNAFSNLAAPAKPPVFVYPIKLARLGINQSITIDFAPYSNLASICRWFISLSFIVWLILITRKIIGQ